MSVPYLALMLLYLLWTSNHSATLIQLYYCFTNDSKILRLIWYEKRRLVKRVCKILVIVFVQFSTDVVRGVFCHRYVSVWNFLLILYKQKCMFFVGFFLEGTLLLSLMNLWVEKIQRKLFFRRKWNNRIRLENSKNKKS